MRVRVRVRGRVRVRVRVRLRVRTVFDQCEHLAQVGQQDVSITGGTKLLGQR